MARATLALLLLAALLGAPPRAFAAPAAGTTDSAGEEGMPFALLIGLAGVAGVAPIGTAVLLARRRRGDRTQVPLPAAALQRRSARRARLRMDDDPIMAAMGIGAEDESRQRRRHQVVGDAPPRRGRR